MAQADGASIHAARASRPNRVKPCSAILLAAGRSSRMGAFKPLLPLGNKTVIECCIDSLREGGVETIGGGVGQRAEDLRSKRTKVSFSINPGPNGQMGASIAAGVREL